MKRNPLSLNFKIVFLLVVTAFCSILINAQNLKSKPQGNNLVKLNGTFDIAATTDEKFAGSNPISAVVADLDGDGINDLIVGHQDSISIQRGDINAFAPKTQEALDAIRDLRFISPFDAKTSFFASAVPADFLQTGDFTRDGRVDILAASRNSNRLVLLEGDGAGNFVATREIFVSGNVTAMTAGDVNRLDGFPDAIVGVGNEVLIYQGLGDIFNAEPSRVYLPNAAQTFAVGQLDTNSFTDIAVGNGNQITIISGSDAENEVSNLAQNYTVKSLLAGEFIPDRRYRAELAALAEDGTIHILSRGDLDTRPVTPKEHLAEEARRLLAKNYPVPQRILRQLSKSDLREPAPVVESDNQSWAEYDQFFGAVPSGAVSANAVLTSGKLSNYGEDLIVVDAASNEIVVMPLVFDPISNEKVSYAGRREVIKFSLESSPVTAIAARLNFDGDRDLLILQNGKVEPAALVTAPEAVFTVNNNGDAVDANPGNGVCATAGAVCTLRAAIMEANRLAGNDSITINAGINITLTTGNPDNDAFGENSASEGDLDIFCAINAAEDSCNLPLNTNANDLSITGAAGGNTISSGTFTTNGLTTTDRVFDIGMDGVFGGGFGAGTGIDVTMSNLTIQNGNVRQDIYTAGAGNFARGGGIRMDGFGPSGTRGSLTLTSVTINNNQADHDTGGVFDQYASINFSSVTATNNIGKAGPGGALQFLAGIPATLSVSASSFTANESRTGMVFTTPATDVDGGAIAANHDTNTGTITNTNFTNNLSQDDGGALKAFNGAFTVTGGTMSGNQARDDGGAVWGDIDTVGAARFLTLSGVTIQGNLADSDNTGVGDGGAVFRDRGTLNVTNSTLGGTGGGQPNNSINGGALAHAFRSGAVDPSNVTTINLDNGSITGNNSENNGGGVFINGAFANTATVLNVGATTSIAVTENNSNVHGGAFAISGGATTNLTRATIHGNDADKDNNATGDGGAIFHNNNAGTMTIATTVSIGTAGQGNTGENGGAIHHSNGTLTLTNPTISSNTTDVHAGALFVSGGTVNVNGVTFASNSSVSGTEVRLTGGTTNFSGTVTIPGELSIAGGTLVAGSSIVNLGEDFHFASGTFTAGTSTFNFNGTAAQQIYGGAVPTFNNITDANTAAQLSVNNNANANGTFTINANAVLNPAAATVIGGTGTLTGSGTVRVTRTAATADFSSQYTITNKTLTNLLVDYVGTSAQVVSPITFGNLRLNNASGATLAAGTTTVGGTLTLQSGVLGVGTSTLVLNNGTSVTGGSLTSGATGTVNYNQGSAGQAVLTANYGNLTFSNFAKTLPAATIGIAGTFTPGSGVGHTIAGNTINFNGAGAQTIPSFTYNNLTTSTGGIKTTGPAVTVNGNLTVGSPTILSVAAGSTLTVVGTLTNNSTIQGTGTIANNFTNTGILAPGFSPGILNMTGNFTNTGTMNIEIGGTAGPGVNPNGHDQLLINGIADITGTLNVTLTNGFTPASGNSFVIIDATSATTNSFTTVNLPNILPLVWNLTRNPAAGTFTLNVIGPTAAAASVSGRIAASGGRAISGARVSVTNSSGVTRTVSTNTFGNYQIDNLAVGETYTITVTAKGYAFSPRVVSVMENISGLDFTADSGPR
jgi:CSLREA domain-containing protein